MAYCSATAEIMYAALDLLLAMVSPLHFGPQFGPRILGMDAGKLAKQFARLFVLGLGRLDVDLHDLVAVLVQARVEDALVAQPELLSVVGALRDLEQCAASDGGHLDFGAERRFPHRDGHLD